MNVYERALEVLDERGWTQGILEDIEGRVCLMGALRVGAVGGAWVWGTAVDDETVRVLLGLVQPDSAHTMLALELWNDDPHTTEEDVRLLLKRAAAGERAELHA